MPPEVIIFVMRALAGARPAGPSKYPVPRDLPWQLAFDFPSRPYLPAFAAHPTILQHDDRDALSRRAPCCRSPRRRPESLRRRRRAHKTEPGPRRNPEVRPSSHIAATAADRLLRSWELGTRAQTLLELDAPAFSAVNASAAVPPALPLSPAANASLEAVLEIARAAVAALPAGAAANASGQPLVDGDGAAGDPASIGIAVLLANWTGLPGADYAGAADAQVRYLLNSVPRTPDGAISHRVSEAQLWCVLLARSRARGTDWRCDMRRSDSVYMVPPFLAYYGVTTGNKSMVQEAYNQVRTREGRPAGDADARVDQAV
jgi:hypothetical protein